MAKLSSLAALVRELQAQGYDTREIVRAVKLALQPGEAALTAAERRLQRIARRMATRIGLGETQLAAARRKLRQTEREIAAAASGGRKRGGLGTALKKLTEPKKKRRTKPLRELSPAYRKRIRRGLAAGKSRQEAGGHRKGVPRKKAPRRQVQLPPQASGLRGTLEFSWDYFSYEDYNGQVRDRSPFFQTLTEDELLIARGRLAVGDEDGMYLAIEAAALKKYLNRDHPGLYEAGRFGEVDQPENPRPEITPR